MNLENEFENCNTYEKIKNFCEKHNITHFSQLPKKRIGFLRADEDEWLRYFLKMCENDDNKLIVNFIIKDLSMCLRPFLVRGLICSIECDAQDISRCIVSKYKLDYEDFGGVDAVLMHPDDVIKTIYELIGPPKNLTESVLMACCCDKIDIAVMWSQYHAELFPNIVNYMKFYQKLDDTGFIKIN